MAKTILEKFDEKFPVLFYFDGGHRDANQDSYTTCQEEVKSFLRTEFVSLAEEMRKKEFAHTPIIGNTEHLSHPDI